MPANRKTRSTRSKRTTNSRGSGTPRRDRTAHKPLKPLTVDHFRRWSSLIVLDNGSYWPIEDFQLEITELVFARYREVLAVLPTGSYKTTTAGGLALYHCQYVPTARVPIGAAAKDQAAIVYEQAKGMVERTPGLPKRFKVQDGYRRIKCHATGGLIRVYSAKDDTGDGVIPTLPILDELHRHRGHDLYGTWRDKLTKRDGTMLVLSTAGDDENNPVEELRDAAHKLPDITRPRGQRKTIARSADRGFVMIEYALREKDDPKDLEIVKLANPAAQVTLEELRMRHDSPSTKTWQWVRFTCNRRTKGEESAVDPDDYDKLYEAGEGEPYADDPEHRRIIIADRAPIYGWLDLGWKVDTTACGILAWERPDRRVVTDITVIEPPVAEEATVLALLRLQHFYGDRKLEDGEPAFRGIVFDPNAGGTQMAQLLEKGTHPLQTDDDEREIAGLPRLNGEAAPPLEFIEHSQDNAPMALASRRLDEAIRSGWLCHDGHRKLRRHVLNAVERTLSGEKWRYDRPSNKLGEGRRQYPIDALSGLLFGHSTAVGEHDEPEEEPPTDFFDYSVSHI